MEARKENAAFELRKLGRRILNDEKRETSVDFSGRKVPMKGAPNSSLGVYDGETLVKRRFFDKNGEVEQAVDLLFKGSQNGGRRF